MSNNLIGYEPDEEDRLALGLDGVDFGDYTLRVENERGSYRYYIYDDEDFVRELHSKPDQAMMDSFGDEEVVGIGTAPRSRMTGQSLDAAGPDATYDPQDPHLVSEEAEEAARPIEEERLRVAQTPNSLSDHTIRTESYSDSPASTMNSPDADDGSDSNPAKTGPAVRESTGNIIGDPDAPLGEVTPSPMLDDPEDPTDTSGNDQADRLEEDQQRDLRLGTETTGLGEGQVQLSQIETDARLREQEAADSGSGLDQVATADAADVQTGESGDPDSADGTGTQQVTENPPAGDLSPTSEGTDGGGGSADDRSTSDITDGNVADVNAELDKLAEAGDFSKIAAIESSEKSKNNDGEGRKGVIDHIRWLREERDNKSDN